MLIVAIIWLRAFSLSFAPSLAATLLLSAPAYHSHASTDGDLR